MFESITNIYLFIGLGLFIVGFLASLMCVSRYLENEKDNAVKRKLAKQNNTEYDTVNEELSKKFWWGYLAVAILGALVAVLIAFVLTDLVNAYHPIGDESRLFAVYIALCVIVWVIGDYFLFTRLGDSAYFARVEYGAIKTFLGDTDETLTEPAQEPEPEVLVAKLTDEQKVALVDALFKNKK